MGIQSVAVHSTADPTRCMCAWPTKASASARLQDRELSVDPAIISACEITGAQAIHPGYGFLVENANFVQIVEDHGMTFIGPTAEHIRVMGDKITAKDTDESLGCALCPGSEGGVPDLERRQTFGRRWAIRLSSRPPRVAAAKA